MQVIICFQSINIYGAVIIINNVVLMSTPLLLEWLLGQEESSVISLLCDWLYVIAFVPAPVLSPARFIGWLFIWYGFVTVRLRTFSLLLQNPGGRTQKTEQARFFFCFLSERETAGSLRHPKAISIRGLTRNPLFLLMFGFYQQNW